MLELTQQDKQTIASVCGRGATQTRWNAYYSRVRFQTTLASLTYTISSGKVVNAFAYAIGQDMATAGQSSNTATAADTCLTVGAQTIGGENFLIKGLGIIALATSDAHLLKQADGQVSVAIVMGGGAQQYKLGIPSMLPGPGGIFGRGESPSVAPNTQDVVYGNIGGVTNGMPAAQNFFSFPEPIIWRAAGSPDSALTVQLKAEYTIATNVNYAIATRTANAATSTFVGGNGYTPPTAANTFLDFLVVLEGVAFVPQSGN